MLDSMSGQSLARAPEDLHSNGMQRRADLDTALFNCGRATACRRHADFDVRMWKQACACLRAG